MSSDFSSGGKPKSAETLPNLLHEHALAIPRRKGLARDARHEHQSALHIVVAYPNSAARIASALPEESRMLVEDLSTSIRPKLNKLAHVEHNRFVRRSLVF